MHRFFFVLTAVVLVPLATGSAGHPVQGRKIIDPTYAAWSRFPEGSAVTFTSVCESSGVPNKSYVWSRVVETTTLVVVSPYRIELRIEKTEEFEMNDERGIKKKIVRMPRKVTPTRLMDAPPPGNPAGKIVEQGEKMIKVDGKPLKAKYKKVEETNIDAEGSVHTIQTWTSDDIPGGLIRQEQKQTGTYWFEYRGEVTTLIKTKK